MSAATTTMATVLAAGRSCQVFSDLEQLMQVSDQWPVERRLRAGERAGESGWLRHGRSSRCTPERVQGRQLFMVPLMAQTLQVQDAPAVLAAAFVNRAAVVQYVLSSQRQCVGSGWEGSFHSKRYGMCRCDRPQPFETNQHLQELAGNDEVIARSLYFQWQDNLLGLFHQASHGKRLLRLDCHEDLKYCAKAIFWMYFLSARTRTFSKAK